LAIYESTYTQSHYDDPQLEPAYDDLVVKAQQAPTLAAQQQYIDQATQVLHDYPPVIFLFPQPLTYAYTSVLSWVPRPEHWLRAYDVSVK
jgi:peptide/nickel transport system substrate-binding protein